MQKRVTSFPKPALLRYYLFLYNQALGFGWITVLLRLIIRGLDDAWVDLGPLVCALQCLVMLDVIHAAFGLWPDDPKVGLLQRLWCKVGHRSEMFITITLSSPPQLRSNAMGLVLLAWAVADVFRYQLYSCRSLGFYPPRWMVWLRYSDFILQYPLVLVAEAWFVASCFLSPTGAVAFVCASLSASVVTPSLLSYSAKSKSKANSVDNAVVISISASSVVMLLATMGWGYGPVALGFQVYEFLIFFPAYETLWRVRTRRLDSEARLQREGGASPYLHSCNKKP